MAAALVFVLSPVSPAQSSQEAAIRPGEWLVKSVVTPSIGHPVTAQTRICASGAGDFWKTPQPGMSCEAPKVSASGSQVVVEIACHGGSGPVTWTTHSKVTEVFNAARSQFHATGTTTTATTLPGRGPMTVTAGIASDGSYQGACSAAK